ncbi:MAG: glycosyltransferase family 39 protein [Victivallales bacterium]
MISSLQNIKKDCGEWLASHDGNILDLVCLTVLSALVIFPGLGQLRVCVSHEVLHAETIREMAESGNYVETKILGERIPDKPPVMHAPAALLTHWLGRPSMTLARFPSALAGLLGILATYGIGLALLNRRAALVGAVALLGIPGYILLARQVLPDMILCAGILFSCLGLVLAMRSVKPSTQILCLAGAGFAAGIGVLTKGPLGFIFPVLFAMLIPFGRPEFKRPRLGWLVFGAGLLVAAGIWAIPAYLLDQGVYLRQVVFQPDLNIASKVTSKPFYIMFAYAFLHSLPISIFLPLAIRDWRRYAYSPLLAVAAAILLIFVCVPKKRDHYLLPMYPFLTLAVAASIVRHSEKSRLVRRTAWTLVPLSVLSYPLFFTVIQPLAVPNEDPEIRFARETLPIIGPNGRVYCVRVHHEFLAWIGQRYEGIVRVKPEYPADIDLLRKAPKGAYLLVERKYVDELLESTGPLPLTEVLSRSVKRKTWVLFRLGVVQE